MTRKLSIIDDFYVFSVYCFALDGLGGRLETAGRFGLDHQEVGVAEAFFCSAHSTPKTFQCWFCRKSVFRSSSRIKSKLQCRNANFIMRKLQRKRVMRSN